MPSVAEELWLNFYEDTKEHVFTLYQLLEDATDKYVIGGLSHGINICKYRILKMYCDELLDDDHLLFIKHMESIAPEAAIEVPLSCRRHIGCSCQKRKDDAIYEAALARLTRNRDPPSPELSEGTAPTSKTATTSPPDSSKDDEPLSLTVEIQSPETTEHDGVISGEIAHAPDGDVSVRQTEEGCAIVEERAPAKLTSDDNDGHSRDGADRDPPCQRVADYSGDWHSLIERLRKAETVSDVYYDDYVRHVGLALADGRVNTNSIRKLPRHEKFKGGGPSDWEKMTRAKSAIPTMADILALFI